jgi:hypothetical protein
VFVVLWFLSPVFAASAESLIDGLLATKEPLVPAAIEKLASQADQQGLTVLAIGYELFATGEQRVQRLLPLIDQQRALAREQVAACTSIAEGCVRQGALDTAAALLDYLDPQRLDPLRRADVASVRAALFLARHQASAANEAYRQSATELHQAVPDAQYANWQSRIVERRLARLCPLIDQALAVETAGPAYAAWLAADKQANEDGYAAVVDGFPESGFATAAALQALRLRLDHGDAKVCLERLAASPGLERGPFAAQALLLRADACLLLGEIKGVKVACDQVLRVLNEALSLPADFNAAEIEAVRPERPPHVLKGAYPDWTERSAGRIWLPAYGDAFAAFYRYQAVMRLAAVAYLGKRRSVAENLARGLVMVDPIDSQMEREQRGPGGLVLAHTFQSDECVISLEGLAEMPPAVQTRFIMGVVCYQVYDWRQCLWWMRQIGDGKDVPFTARSGSVALMAGSAMMLDRRSEAIAFGRSLEIGKGERPNKSWYAAHQFAMQVHLLSPCDYPAAMTVLQEVIDQAPGTVFAQDALMSQAEFSICFDPALSRRLWLQFRSTYPGRYKEAVSGGIKDAEARLAEMEQRQ